MPVVAYRIDAGLYQAVQGLVSAGEYTSLEEFLDRAVRNQLALELEPPAIAASRGVAAMADSRAPAAAPVRLAAPVVTAANLVTAPFMLPDSIHLPSPGAPSQRSDAPIWGQINRFLPLKLACRRILALAQGTTSWPSLDSVLDGLPEQAAALGSALHAADLAAGRKRDQLATGLPRTDNVDSQERFTTQIVAKTVRGGAVYPGAVAAFGLATIADGIAALTDAGARFAVLTNPVLDGDLRRAEATLSVDERRYITTAIVGSMRTELLDFSLVVDAVRRGHTSPDSLHDAIEPLLATRRWTPAMVRTHLSGVLSRMIEVDVMRRTWEGRNVTYSLGPLAAILPREPAINVNQGDLPS